jgi:hypothetical protein
VSCSSASQCLAVGTATLDNGNTLAFASSEAASTWTSVDLARPHDAVEPGLSTLSCSSTTSCVALGSDFSTQAAANHGVNARVLVDTLAGSSWTAATLPRADRALQPEILGASCVASTTCVAVGAISTTNPSTFVPQTNGGTGYLVAFEGGGGPSHALVETLGTTGWLRSVWHDPAGPPSAQLRGVACRADRCVAVGSFDTTPGTDPLVETRVGSAWTAQELARPAGTRSASLSHVSCPSPSVCYALGTDVDARGITHLMIAHEVGATWTEHTVPSRAGLFLLYPLSISCGSPVSCIAVGLGYDLRSDADFQFVEVLAHGRWHPVGIPRPVGEKGSIVSGVSCVDRSRCVAVGGTYQRSFVATLTGSSWSAVNIPSPMRRAQLQLDTISCRSSDACVAVGVVQTRGKIAVFAEVLHGSRWSSRQLTPFTAAWYPDTMSISCAASDSCAVTVVSAPLTFSAADLFGSVTLDQVLSFDGAATRVSTIRPPAGSEELQLDGVSCLPTSRCVAVGIASFPNGDDLPVVAAAR